MESSVRDTLVALIVRYGQSLSEDPPRCEAMLRDLCGQHKREIFILVSALKQRVATDLLSGGGLPTSLLLGRLSKRLEDELALTSEAAHWAVETWALVLGVIAGPVPGSTTTAATQPTPKPVKTQPPPLPLVPLAVFRDPLKDGSVGPEMVRLPSGRFLMGPATWDDMAHDSERPQHEVRIALPFALGRFPVTFNDYDHFIAATNRQPPDDQGGSRGRRPVNYVSWHDAVAYCVWLSEQTGRTYRLPSEAEWEYACRAGTATRWSCGDDEKALGDYAWFDVNSGRKTHPVGKKLPNHWGLHDMHGNIWEWVQDGWHDNYHGAPADGTVWEDASGEGRLVRGGSWYGGGRFLRSAFRARFYPGDRRGDAGFRLALGPEPGSTAAGK